MEVSIPLPDLSVYWESTVALDLWLVVGALMGCSFLGLAENGFFKN